MQKIARSLATNDDGHVVGEDHHRAKLTDHEIWLIHELRAEGMRRREIAEKFEVSVYTIIEILSGRRRAHSATGQKRRT
jgi:transposase